MSPAQLEGANFVRWFRSAVPYLRAHRDRTFTLFLGSNAVAGGQFAAIIRDLALMAAVGVRLVVVYGTRHSIDARLHAHGDPSRLVRGLRATDPGAMESIRDVAGQIRFELEAQFSMALSNLPGSRSSVPVVSGNFVHARPAGVRDGVDLQATGLIRRINTDGIAERLREGLVVLIPPIGYSPSGELFNLDAMDLAAQVAIGLQSDKLILLDDGLRFTRTKGDRLRELTLSQARQEIEQHRAQNSVTRENQALELISTACHRGVSRGHLVDSSVDGALLSELFTRDGQGTMVAADAYDDTRTAQIEDIPGIVALINPLERAGVLVPRPRDQIERDIEAFLVMERDGAIIGCAATEKIDESRHIELACFAIHEDYRNGERGDALLRRAEQAALRRGGTDMFVLTTHAVQWFSERGFILTRIEALPVGRQQTYNFHRNSKVLTKALSSE